MISCFSNVRLFVTLCTVAHQAPLSKGFSRQEYWNGLPCPPPGDLPDPRFKSTSLISSALAGRFFTTSATWESQRQRNQRSKYYDPMNVGYLISGSSAFSKSSLNIWDFSVHVLLKPSLENVEPYFASMWNWAVVWTFFGTALLWDWNENWSFAVLWPLLSFPNLLAYWVQHFNSIIFKDLN